MTGNCGVLYIASGESYVTEAARSAASIREHTSLPTALATDTPVDTSAFDHIVDYDCERVTVDGRDWLLNSTIPAGLSPFDRTLYLDTDTLVRADITSLFDCLDDYELAVARVPERPPVAGRPDYWRLFNCGVILYRETPAVAALFEDWRDRYRATAATGQPEDQPAFAQALFDSDVRWYCLPREYNVRAPRRLQLAGKVKIVHGRHPAGLDAVARELEQSTSPRVVRERSRWLRPACKVDARGTLRYHVEAALENHGWRTLARVGAAYVLDSVLGTDRMREFGGLDLG